MGRTQVGKFNNEEIFNQIFRDFRGRVYAFVLVMTKSPLAAEELTQDIFLKLWLRRDTIEEIDNLEGYLFTSARNKSLNFLRKAANDLRFVKELAIHMTPACNDVEETLNAREYAKRLQQGVSQLPPQQRLVYELSRTEGLNHDEIANRLNISKNTVKNHLTKTLLFLRRYLIGNTGHANVLLFFILSGFRCFRP